MDDKIMLSRREHRAVVLAIVSSAGNPANLAPLAQAAVRAGLSPADIDAIVAGGIPAERELADVVAVTYLVLDKRGVLDEQDRFDVRSAGIGPLKLAEIVQLSQIDTEVFAESPRALVG